MYKNIELYFEKNKTSFIRDSLNTRQNQENWIWQRFDYFLKWKQSFVNALYKFDVTFIIFALSQSLRAHL